MAKSGLDYFPLACSFEDKIELIEAEFGLRGLAIIVKLYQKIYGEFGYYCEWNDEVALLFSRKACGLPEGDNVVSEVIKAAIKREIFDNNMFLKYSILTSAGIQKRYFEAAKRRNEIEVEKSYLLVNASKLPKNVNIIQGNVYRNEKNVYRNQQSKVKESKGNKSKGKEDICAVLDKPAPTSNIRIPLNDKTFYDVPLEKIDAWKDVFPAVNVEEQLKRMVVWCNANPTRKKTRRGIERFITNWLSREQDRGGRYCGGVRSKNNLEEWANEQS